ncbi:MAG TPA: MaoC family dehydratase N-terminal domain-containing protein [Candidatus Binataceae bacterium]|nr:MaoC family dehydratase N-terminal domain-containing protein [Candidatus Binataceae bacterium]
MPEFDPSLIGRVFRTVTPVRITAQMITDFCAVMGDQNPLYAHHGAGAANAAAQIAPPAIAAAFRALEDIFHQIPDDKPRLAAGMDVEFIEPIRAGDAISVASQLAETYKKTGRSGPMTFFVIRSTVTNQNDRVVARIEHRFTYRG